MEMREVATKMSSLLHMNEGAVKAYDEAINKVQDQNTKQQFQEFRGEHQHHVQQLQQWFQQSAQQQTQPAKEYQNLMQVCLQTVRAAQGEQQLMQAMHVAEALDNACYGESIEGNIPTDVKQMLQEHLRMEHHHLQAIERRSPLMSMTTGTMGGTTGGTYGGGGY